MVDKRCIGWAALLYLGATMVGLGIIYTGSIFTNKTSASTSSPYALTLVETMNVNSSTPQPKFFVLGSNGLETSAADISLPAHRQIQLTIVSYDMPTPGSTDQQGKVTGTVGGNVYLVNGTIATYGNATWGMNVSSMPGSALAHTFTVPQLGINIPVVGDSTVIAYLYLDQTGTFSWICLTPCGMGMMGDRGAMSQPGWMEGQITVQ
jgi:hypothetical protein